MLVAKVLSTLSIFVYAVHAYNPCCLLGTSEMHPALQLLVTSSLSVKPQEDRSQKTVPLLNTRIVVIVFSSDFSLAGRERATMNLASTSAAAHEQSL